MQHWLEDTNQLYLTGYLSVERDPSPDGTTQGLLTFYDYQGKLTGYNFCAGSYPLPSVQSWRLPNGETHYEHLLFDYFGNITNDITTYTPPSGGWAIRTNQFIYAGNTYTYLLGTWSGGTFINTASQTNFTVPNLLSQVIGTDGNTLWSYGGFDTVKWTNFYPNGPQTNGSLMTLQRVLPDYATNGLGQVTTVTYVRAGTPVNYYDMFKGTPSNTNYDYGTLLATTYSGNNKMTSTTTAAGLTTTNIYNTGGFLTKKIDLQIGRTNSLGYTTDGLVGAFTNELGLNVSATWDNLLRLTSIQFPDGTFVSNVYNKLDLGGERDRLGNWTFYGYDGARHLTAITNANNAVWLLSWCGCGVVTDIQDPLSHVTTFNYDNAGDLTNKNYPDGSALNWEYNLAGWPTNFSDGSGRALQLGYDNQGWTTTVSNAAGQVHAGVYDIRDRPTIMTDANAVTMTNSYDVMNELLTQTGPDGVSDCFGYAASGLLAWTNRDNQVTFYGRDVAGRLVSMTNASLQVVDASFNPAGERISLTDGLSHKTTWGFNQYGWLTSKTNNGNTNIINYTYDADGRVTNRWMMGTNTGYKFDAVGNLTNINYPAKTVVFGYDAINELTSMTDPVGTTTFTWTSNGLLASETSPWSSDTLSYGYSQGHRTNLSLTQPSLGAWTQTYGYDSAWRMTGITSSAGTFDYTYASSINQYQVGGITLPNGASIANQYDNLGRLTSTALLNSWGHPLDAYVYGLDLLGLRTNIARQLGLTTNNVVVGYDAMAEVSSWTAKEANGTSRENEQLGYGYDAGNNLHLRTNNSLVQTFTVDTLNQLSSVTRSGTMTLSGALPAPASSVAVNGAAAQTYGDLTFAAAGNTLSNGTNTFTIAATNAYGVAVTNTLAVNLPATVNFQYDANGNLTNDGTRSFYYDAENRLTNVTVPTQYQTVFAYDGLSRRRLMTNYVWQSSVWTPTNATAYIYDGMMVLQERNASNNTPVVTYTRGLDLSSCLTCAGGIGGLLARTDANGSTYYHADGNGNITGLIDTNQLMVARYLYDPSGKRVAQNGSMASVNEMGFSSMPTLNGGIIGYPFRFYEPNFGRWLNHDPIQEAGGINLYGFVGNSPVNVVDPYGLAWYNPWSWGVWDSIANAVYPQPNTPAATQAPANAANSLVDPDDAALDRALANGATPGSAYPGAGQQAADETKQMLATAGQDLAQAVMMAIPGGAEEEEMAAASKLAKAAEKCEKHHLLPRQFANNFKRVGLNPDDYTMDLSAAKHRLLPDGIHTGPAADSWNGQWNQFFQNNPNYTQQDVLNQLSSMQQQFGLK